MFPARRPFLLNHSTEGCVKFVAHIWSAHSSSTVMCFTRYMVVMNRCWSSINEMLLCLSWKIPILFRKCDSHRFLLNVVFACHSWKALGIALLPHSMSAHPQSNIIASSCAAISSALKLPLRCEMPKSSCNIDKSRLNYSTANFSKLWKS